MAAITINDLSMNRDMDRAAMAAISGGGAPWVYGWIRPFTSSEFGSGSVVNFYQINNYADQMINQIQVVDVNNSAANANINVAVAGNSTNNRG
ncbi:hypothetical protein SAMN06265795_1353 [Noviherbaspirillum humi]|uniref:Uncharacterized protein n=1 Tax=Noviherbaspirillum humi TaxID=1688639 RepID=A0A239M7P0_9BURK|nr:hypothetical protein [Noviherbaspirillum humi]SNT38746.1 hypothetical protein SAMN06265795_1353 [Noviherbaspirillum humi]